MIKIEEYNLFLIFKNYLISDIYDNILRLYIKLYS